MHRHFGPDHRWRKPRFGLRTDRDNGYVFGVCAGIARRLGLTPLSVRILFLVAAIPFGMVWLLVPLYIVLGLMLDDYRDDPATRPLETQGFGGSRPAGPAPRPATADPTLRPSQRFNALRKQFEDLERRTGHMEREVTSTDFTLSRAFKDLEGDDRR